MRIGVTGNFASGKGTVCSFFEKLGGIIIDTDIIAREVVSPNGKALNQIIQTFGNSFIDEKGQLKRREFASYIFEDKERTETLNSILHPLILLQTLNLSANYQKMYFINAPLLFEAKFDEHTDLNIFVKASNEQSIKRGVLRDNLSENEIISRLNHQFSINEKENLADYIIDNSGTLENTKNQVDKIWKILISSLHQKMKAAQK